MIRRIVALFAIVVLVVVIAVGAYGWSQGARFYSVESGSMSPILGSGDLVIDLPVTSATVFHVGDVVTFHPTPGYTTTHRIVAITKDGITTRGDANPTDDVGYIQPRHDRRPRRVVRPLRRGGRRLLPAAPGRRGPHRRHDRSRARLAARHVVRPRAPGFGAPGRSRGGAESGLDDRRRASAAHLRRGARIQIGGPRPAV